MDFIRNNVPSVMGNPLPNHTGPIVNAIMEDSGIKVKTKMDEIKSSMDEVYYVMVKMRVIPKKEISFKENEVRCFCHMSSANHTIRKCEDFKNLLQAMMDREEIEFFEEMIEESVNVITDAKFVGKSSFKRLKPLTIFFEDDSIPIANTTMHHTKLIVKVLSLFPYMDNKMVPWNYNCSYMNESVAENILGIGNMT